MATRRLTVKHRKTPPKGPIKRIDPEDVLGLRITKKVSKLQPKKIKGIRPPGRQPKNYKSPSQ